MSISEKVLHRLYVVDHKSMFDIASILHCSIHKIEYWLRKYNIPRRNRSDANYAKYNPDGEPFTIKSPLTPKEQNLYHLALGLYWGEGGKTVNHSTRLGNSDPSLILIYYKFLRDICQIASPKIHFHLQVFKDTDISNAKKHWSDILNIDQSKITTGKPTKSLGRGSYKKVSQYGVMTVGVYNTHFHTWIMEQLQQFGYNPPVN